MKSRFPRSATSSTPRRPPQRRVGAGRRPYRITRGPRAARRLARQGHQPRPRGLQRQRDGRVRRRDVLLGVGPGPRYRAMEERWDASGHRAAADLVPSYGSSSPASLFAVNGKLLFTAGEDYTEQSRGLWASDGTAAGTHFLKHVQPDPNMLVVVGNLLFFQAPDPTGPTGRELWVSDGTTAGTHLRQGHQSRPGQQLPAQRRLAPTACCSSPPAEGPTAAACDSDAPKPARSVSAPSAPADGRAITPPPGPTAPAGPPISPAPTRSTASSCGRPMAPPPEPSSSRTWSPARLAPRPSACR